MLPVLPQSLDETLSQQLPFWTVADEMGHDELALELDGQGGRCGGDDCSNVTQYDFIRLRHLEQ